MRIGLLRFVARRFAALVLLTIGITAVTFALTQLVPSNAAATNLGEQAAGDPAAVAAFEHHYGLDKPLPARYALYLKDKGKFYVEEHKDRRDFDKAYEVIKACC